MTRTAAASQPGSEFHSFLFAPIGQDSNGLPLSVISAIARLDLDPWQEAATLAGLPADKAVEKVLALFRTVPDQTLSEPDRGTMASRLIALLPRKATDKISGPAGSVNVGDVSHSRLGIGALIFAILMFVLMATQFVMARFETPSQGSSANAPPPIAAPSRTSPTTSGQ